MEKLKKRALITDNGTELGFHLAYQLTERGYKVDMITDVPMDNTDVTNFHINWYKIDHQYFKNFAIKSNLFDTNKNPYDIIIFNHFLTGGPSETDFLPYVETEDIHSWQNSNFLNIIVPYQIIKEISNYIKHNTKIIFKLNGIFDFNWPEGFKYGTTPMFESARICLLKSLSLYVHGIYNGINISDGNDNEEKNIATEIINTIENLNKDMNGSILHKNGNLLIK